MQEHRTGIKRYGRAKTITDVVEHKVQCGRGGSAGPETPVAHNAVRRDIDMRKSFRELVKQLPMQCCFAPLKISATRQYPCSGVGGNHGGVCDQRIKAAAQLRG